MEIRPILSSLLRNKTGAVLVAVQVALSMAILSNALHIVNLRRDVMARPSGVADEASTFAISIRRLGTTTHESQMAAQNTETATLRALPGVASVAKVNQMPLNISGSSNGISVSRTQVKDTAEAAFYVSPDSLVKTWGLKLVEGRDFLPAEVVERDSLTSDAVPHVAIVTRALADKLWPGAANAVGKPLYFGTGETATEMRVVGVVEQLQTPPAQVGERGALSVIVPLRGTSSFSFSNYTVRTDPGERDRVMKDAEAALRRVSPGPVIVRTTAMSDDRTNRYKADVAMAWMLVTVSVLLLLITASGIVGMASLWVTQRRKQIGVRRALGARRVDVLRYFITENVMITSAGVVAGVLLAIGLNQLLVAKLEMPRLPLPYLLFGAGIFWGLGILAVYGPAWRAASTSPALATRSA